MTTNRPACSACSATAAALVVRVTLLDGRQLALCHTCADDSEQMHLFLARYEAARRPTSTTTFTLRALTDAARIDTPEPGI